ncbi:hypothetical protein LZ198_17225 [Myxococcus sp. K15C18031901]|uniref:hypothetical protein n=1 Tax=Myxococcus dinghuensis TaxID=2906761 RepID=UPI0020A80487|nr:hypothetical protein [Myxococcus dinghuensis]MCP3100615.1 hypothetical protein [Myxococcus dinghuensis]
MRERSFRRWTQVVALTVGAVWSVGCGGLPETGGKQPDEPRGGAFAQRGTQPEALLDMQGEIHAEKAPPYLMTADRGHNGTIKQIGSSIDPRTPKLEGQQNKSIHDDSGKMMQHRYGLEGGAGYSPSAQGLGGEDGASVGGPTDYNHSWGYRPVGWQDRNVRPHR